jgi:hypothetical protein
MTLRVFSRIGFVKPAIIAAAVVAAGGGWKPKFELAPRQQAPMVGHHVRDGQFSSTNWSGYAVTGGNGSVTDVEGSWVVPAIQGSCPSSNQYSSFWVGIDGFNSNSVEQTGTDSDCQGGSPVYYAWFEFYPHPSFIVNSVPVKPGDVIYARVTKGGSRYTVTLTNKTTGQTFSTTSNVHSAQASSAEWIAEAPSSSGGVLPLADFGSVGFGQDNTPVPGTSYATVHGVTGALGSFGSNVQSITMVTSGGVTKAQPSPVSADGTSFTVQWFSPGP